MIGTAAERSLIGALLLSPSSHRLTVGLVSADDFSDDRMGVIFLGMGRMLSQNVPVNVISVGNNFATWQIRGLDVTALHEWTAETPAAYRAAEFAEAVHDAAIRRSLADIASRALAASSDPGWLAPDAVSLALTELEQLRAGVATAAFVARRLADILAESDDYDWIVPGLLERRDRLVLTGAEGIGKTTFVRQMALLCAAGLHPFTGAQMEPVKVLVVDAENTERQWRRAVRYLVTLAARRGALDPAQAVHLMAGNRIDITKEAHLGAIHRLVDLHKPDVLFIGPLYKLVPKGITNDDDAAPLIVALDSLRERDLALVMEAHAGKSTGSDGDRDLRPRGSSALLGWPEFGFGLAPVADDPDMIRMKRWRGDRESRDWPKHIRHGVDGEFPWVAADALYRP
jgi:replicative DNA helicase